LLGLTVDPFMGMFFLISMIFCGKMFREDWNNKRKNWVLLAWLYGGLAFFSFVAIAFIPLDFP
jgi:Ca2+/Na+ antiporter